MKQVNADMPEYDIPHLPEECKDCTIYQRVKDYSDGLMVKKDVIAKMQQDIQELKSKVSKHSKGLAECQESQKHLIKVVEKQGELIKILVQTLTDYDKELGSKLSSLMKKP